jgi:hypothetical protein
MAEIGHPRAFVGTSPSATEGVNSSMVEFLNAVARIQPGCVEFRDTLDQGGQSHSHWRLCPLSLDDRGKQEFVLPRGLNIHVDEEPFLLTMAAQR